MSLVAAPFASADEAATPRRLHESLARRAVRIRLVRIGLFAGAIAVALGFGLTIVGRLTAPVDRIETAQVDDTGRLTISAPRFFGRSAAGQRIEIQAANAVRDSTDLSAPILLDMPRMTASDGTIATAHSGSWQEPTQTLVLRGLVDVVLPDGGRTTADEAVWRPLQGVTGTAAEGSELVLSGRVRMQRDNGDVVEAQQASWDSGRNMLLLYGATSFRQANGDSIAAPSAQWDTRSGALSMSGGVEYRRGNQVFARAGTLAWSRNAGRAELAGGVVLSMPRGEARSRKASINVPANTIIGEGSVVLATPLGRATAGAYEYNARTGRLVLRGGARITSQR
ncbi:MAG: hypothetical protein MUF14_01665 [Hyphomonadaceae bacterium]|jgi:hypothetical protein|nr:hypothetical protein [Hyphomonadaceae bacterium]